MRHAPPEPLLHLHLAHSSEMHVPIVTDAPNQPVPVRLKQRMDFTLLVNVTAICLDNQVTNVNCGEVDAFERIQFATFPAGCQTV